MIYLKGLFVTSMMIGCPPHQHIKFDWKLAYNKSKTEREPPVDCYYPDPELPCFYFYNGKYTKLGLFLIVFLRLSHYVKCVNSVLY